MKVAIIGYGKMGQMIEKICLQRGHEISLIIDKNNAHELNPNNIAGIDVAIDFSTPDAAFENILKCIESKIPVVSGTTGWLSQKADIEEACKENETSFFYASNFSIGVNILFSINRKLAETMNKYNQYNCRIEEVHHVHKLDAPSGTAISLAEDMIDSIQGLERWTLVDSALENTNELGIISIREGEVTGKHTITYESDVDIISLKHEAKNRVGFAQGAVLAAEFLKGKKGIYTMQDLLAF
jgi:4-hydroxy-tetrahydrodipicolinate reductase